MTDRELMGLALQEAEKAAALGEVPVGAVVAKDGQPVPSCWPSSRPARFWGAGGCGSANCL